MSGSQAFASTFPHSFADLKAQVSRYYQALDAYDAYQLHFHINVMTPPCNSPGRSDVRQAEAELEGRRKLVAEALDELMQMAKDNKKKLGNGGADVFGRGLREGIKREKE